MDKTFNIGRMIKKYLDIKNYKRTTVAEMIGTYSTSIYTYEQQPSMQTSTLLKVCHGLKYNFFMDIASSLPREYEHGQVVVSEMQVLLANQAEEIKKLKLENELMRDLMMGRRN